MSISFLRFFFKKSWTPILRWALGRRPSGLPSGPGLPRPILKKPWTGSGNPTKPSENSNYNQMFKMLRTSTSNFKNNLLTTRYNINRWPTKNHIIPIYLNLINSFGKKQAIQRSSSSLTFAYVNNLLHFFIKASRNSINSNLLLKNTPNSRSNGALKEKVANGLTSIMIEHTLVISNHTQVSLVANLPWRANYVIKRALWLILLLDMTIFHLTFGWSPCNTI